MSRKKNGKKKDSKKEKKYLKGKDCPCGKTRCVLPEFYLYKGRCQNLEMAMVKVGRIFKEIFGIDMDNPGC